jgi:hypothetical protein
LWQRSQADSPPLTARLVTAALGACFRLTVEILNENAVAREQGAP